MYWWGLNRQQLTRKEFGVITERSNSMTVIIRNGVQNKMDTFGMLCTLLLPHFKKYTIKLEKLQKWSMKRLRSWNIFPMRKSWVVLFSKTDE